MTTHVFIVNKDTFKSHLKYLFAGTGAGDDDIDFNGVGTTLLNSGKENKLAGMAADASRIRQGDKILFYLLQSNDGEGKFYGVFRARHNFSFIERNNGTHYLYPTPLPKSLLFRTLIEPDSVYAKGVSEWEALDSITGMTSPNQMLWSLIYRKLKANRGNTMITIYESERLCQQIRNKNLRTNLTLIGAQQFDYNSGTQEIEVISANNVYSGSAVNTVDLLPRMIFKYSANRAFETHLQAYIVKSIGQRINISLDNAVLLPDSTIEWLGNEMSCGVGMQKIDVAISLACGDVRTFIPIELKAVPVYPNVVRQIKRYIEWIEQYYIPNRESDIQPVIIAKRTVNRGNADYIATITEINNFNAAYTARCLPIKYIEYELNAAHTDLVFTEIHY